LETQTYAADERFTRRLESFGDLVFGFSLSLLATRLDVPATVAGVFTAPRTIGFLLTFVIMCVLWLEHYRIFRHHFIARPFDVAVNFAFLLGVAVLPFALATFLRFKAEPTVIDLYFGDFALLLASMSTLRLSGLMHRRDALEGQRRLHDWQRVLAQVAIVAVMLTAVPVLRLRLVTPNTALIFFAAFMATIAVTIRRTVRRLPRFLR